jgi:hypothetical protein
LSLQVKPGCSVESPGVDTSLQVVPGCPGTTTFGNTEQSFTAECGAGFTGDPVTVTISAGTYTSEVSQEDADAQALAAATSQATAALSCTPIPLHDCGTTPTSIAASIWTSESGSHGETVMVAGDGTFSYETSEGSGGHDTETYICNPCPDPYEITVTINASATASGPFSPSMMFSLFINDVMIQQGGLSAPGEGEVSGTVVLVATIPAAAVAHIYLDIGLLSLSCSMSGTIQVRPLTSPCLDVVTYLSREQTFTAECGEGLVGEPFTVTKLAGDYTSLVSQEDADAQALAAATDEANAGLTCIEDPCPQPYPETIYSPEAIALGNAFIAWGGLGAPFGDDSIPYWDVLPPMEWRRFQSLLIIDLAFGGEDEDGPWWNLNFMGGASVYRLNGTCPFGTYTLVSTAFLPEESFPATITVYRDPL